MSNRKFKSIDSVPNYLAKLTNKSFTYECSLLDWQIEIMPASLISNWETELVPFPLNENYFSISIFEIQNQTDIPSYRKLVNVAEREEFTNFKYIHDTKWDTTSDIDVDFTEICELLYYVDRLNGLRAFK